MSFRHYDKYTYAVKRKNEKETSTPKGSGTDLKKTNSSESPKRNSGLVPLTVNRDGFAISEDGTLQSRVVSPPLHSHQGSFHGEYAPAMLAPQNGSSNALKGSQASLKGSKGGSSGSSDGWQRLVQAVRGEFSEEELVTLQWETVQGLLSHFGITNPVEVARAQLIWKRKQNNLFDDIELVNEEPSGTQTPKPLSSQPIESITYGRPASPRGSGKRIVPPHKQPLKWEAKPKVDCGQTVH